MGIDLTGRVHQIEVTIPRVPQLDACTADLVRASIAEVAGDPSAPPLLAAILFGSIARREARPLTDPSPSDVDILLIFAHTDELGYLERQQVFAALGRAESRFLDAPREIHVMLASRSLAEWSADFLSSVARDGLLLWSCTTPVELAAPLAALAARATHPHPLSL